MARKRIICIRQPELADEEWALLAPHLPEPRASARGGPRPVPNRPVVEGILWILRNGARWRAMPEGFPAPATCWRRISACEADGTWVAARRAFLGALDDRMRLRWDECCADGSFAPAKKGATASVPPRRARGPNGCSSSTATATASRWPATSTRPAHRR
ncbi:transposase [Isosphaeraceae bacterium EP7]